MNVLEFRIDRAKWLHAEPGNGDNRSQLLRPSDNKECCLGFLAEACGYEQDEIRGVPAPSDIKPENLFRKVDSWEKASDRHIFRRLLHIDAAGDLTHTTIASDMMLLNDGDAESSATTFDHATVESELTEKFAAIGIGVTFLGECPLGMRHPYFGQDHEDEVEDDG